PVVAGILPASRARSPCRQALRCGAASLVGLAGVYPPRWRVRGPPVEDETSGSFGPSWGICGRLATGTSVRAATAGASTIVVTPAVGGWRKRRGSAGAWDTTGCTLRLFQGDCTQAFP